MTAQILATELGNLIQDSKRKNTELRNAAEKALQDLKALSVTSEAQLAAGECLSPTHATNMLIIIRLVATALLHISVPNCLQYSKCQVWLHGRLMFAETQRIQSLTEGATH